MGKHHGDLIIYTDEGKLVIEGADFDFNPISKEMDIINVEDHEEYKQLER